MVTFYVTFLDVFNVCLIILLLTINTILNLRTFEILEQTILLLNLKFSPSSRIHRLNNE